MTSLGSGLSHTKTCEHFCSRIPHHLSQHSAIHSWPSPKAAPLQKVSHSSLSAGGWGIGLRIANSFPGTSARRCFSHPSQLLLNHLHPRAGRNCRKMCLCSRKDCSHSTGRVGGWMVGWWALKRVHGEILDFHPRSCLPQQHIAAHQMPHSERACGVTRQASWGGGAEEGHDAPWGCLHFNSPSSASSALPPQRVPPLARRAWRKGTKLGGTGLPSPE